MENNKLRKITRLFDGVRRKPKYKQWKGQGSLDVDRRLLYVLFTLFAFLRTQNHYGIAWPRSGSDKFGGGKFCTVAFKYHGWHLNDTHISLWLVECLQIVLRVYNNHWWVLNRILFTQVRTLFVSGLPMDVRPREIYLLFRTYDGYTGSSLKLMAKHGKIPQVWWAGWHTVVIQELYIL